MGYALSDLLALPRSCELRSHTAPAERLALPRSSELDLLMVEQSSRRLRALLRPSCRRCRALARFGTHSVTFERCHRRRRMTLRLSCRLCRAHVSSAHTRLSIRRLPKATISDLAELQALPCSCDLHINGRALLRKQRALLRPSCRFGCLAHVSTAHSRLSIAHASLVLCTGRRRARASIVPVGGKLCYGRPACTAALM